MGFISAKDYLRDGRDAKRLTDINSLYTKLSSTQVLGANIESLVIPLSTSNLTINGGSGTSTLGTANRLALKELKESFLDPNSTEGNPIEYDIGYLNGVITFEDLSKKAYGFLELRTKLEETDEYAYYGDYVKIKPNDSDNLFGAAGTIQVPPKDCPESTENSYKLPPTAHGYLVTGERTEMLGEKNGQEVDGYLVYKQSFTCIGGMFKDNLGPEVFVEVRCNSPFEPREADKLCVLVCAEEGKKAKSWTYINATNPDGSSNLKSWSLNIGAVYPAPIWDDTTKSYIYDSPDREQDNGRKESDYPAFKACTDLGRGWRMPRIDEIISIPGYYNSQETCRGMIYLKSYDNVEGYGYILSDQEATGKSSVAAWAHINGNTSYESDKRTPRKIFCVHD